MKKKWRTAVISLLIIAVGIFVYLYFFNSETAPMLAGKNSEVKETQTTTQEKEEEPKAGNEAKPVSGDDLKSEESKDIDKKSENKSGDEPENQEPKAKESKVEDKSIYLVYGLDKAEKKEDKVETDLVMTVTLNPESDSIHILFIPPNTTLAGDQLKNIYTAEEVKGLEERVEELTNQTMDGYIGVDYQSFVNLIDGIGEIEVTIEEEIQLGKYGLVLEKGSNKLSGKETLKLLRLKRPNTTVLERIERQKQVAKAVYNQLREIKSLSELQEVSNSLLKLRDELETDVTSDQIIKGTRFFSKGITRVNIDILSGYTKEGLWVPNNK